MGMRLALYEKKEQRMIIDQGGSVTRYELYYFKYTSEYII